MAMLIDKPAASSTCSLRRRLPVTLALRPLFLFQGLQALVLKPLVPELLLE